MKKMLKFVAITLALATLNSCGGSGNNLSEVKLIPVKSGEEYQYIDKEGKIVINPQFKNATIFREGLALVQTSGEAPKWGFVSEDGKYAINARYKAATVFNEELAWVINENAAPSAIDINGELKFTLQNAEKVRVYKDGLAAYSMINEEGEEKWGFVDKTGQVKINPQFASVGNFSNSKCAVKNNEEKWGYIDKDGKIIINNQFDNAEEFNNGTAVVTLGGKSGFIDSDGKYIINPQFSGMRIDGNMCMIIQDGKWGWCDKTGKITINPQFGQAFPFNGYKLAAVQSGKSFGYIDINGKIVINPQFDIALPFNGNLALVQSSGKFGFIDNNGKYVINPQFDNVSDDLTTHMLRGSSTYESVNTDYFNIGAITSIINIDSPEGFTFTSTFADIGKKLEHQGDEFEKYSEETYVIRDKKISNDASYSFVVIGNAYDKYTVQRGDGWYTYTDYEYKFNEQKSPRGYGYVISFSGKGNGKEKDVISAIHGMLSGYKLFESRSNDNVYIYINGKKEINLINNPNNVFVVIRNISQEEEGNNEEFVN